MMATGPRAGIFKLAVLWFSELLNWLDAVFTAAILCEHANENTFFSRNGVNLIRFLLRDTRVRNKIE